MHILTIPSRWLAVLAAVQTVAPDAVLAGGALRDLAAGVPFKDIDIFVGADRAEYGHQAAIAGTLLKFDPDLTYGQRCDFTSCAELSDCLQSDTYRLSDGLEVNLIVLTQGGLEHVVNRIDFGICQIGTDGERVYETDARILDLFSGTFTLVRGDTSADVERSMRRWERLSQKYPGWTLFNPVTFS